MCCLPERADPDSSFKKNKLKPLLKSFLAGCNWDQLLGRANSPHLSVFQQLIRGQAHEDRTWLVGRFLGKTSRGLRERDLGNTSRGLRERDLGNASRGLRERDLGNTSRGLREGNRASGGVK